MKFLIAGLGSAGERHLANLLELGVPPSDIVIYRQTDRKPRNTDLRRFEVRYDLDAALAERPDAVLVCNPTALHVRTAIAAAEAGAHLFIEKPLGACLDGVAELVATVAAKNLKAMMGCMTRFHPLLKKIKELLHTRTLGDVLCARAYVGEYLPDWHPWEDYRNGYAARHDLGGGAAATQSHELDYFLFLFGDVVDVTARIGRISPLEIDVEDYVAAQFGFKSGVQAELHIDYFTRPPKKNFEAIFTGGRLEWDFHAGVLTIDAVADGRRQEIRQPADFTRNDMFREMLRHFIECIAGGEESAVPLSEGIKVMQIIDALKRSAAERKTVRL